MDNKNSYKAFPPYAMFIVLKDMWNSVMTIEHSPLRKLDPRVEHGVYNSGFYVALFLVLQLWTVSFGIMQCPIVIISGIIIACIQ